MTQHPLFLARKYRDIAIAQADDNADPDWKCWALAAVHHCADHHDLFMSEEVWKVLNRWQAEFGIEIQTDEPRAMGPVMLHAQRLGWIKPTRQFGMSTNPKQHGRPCRFWSSYE